jgi:hypothetical protein
MALKRRVLEILAKSLHMNHAGRRSREWTNNNPHAEEYAKFRAVTEKRRACWPEWPARLREGLLEGR